ncbi:unnamed protein product, partial [Porites evermanni]
FQPSNRGLVVDLQQAVFVRYVGFAFKWNSSLSTLNFTVDYSLDGIHWSDYVEDERLKIFRAQKEDQGQCLCRKLFTRFLRIKSINEEDIGDTLEGYVEASLCSTFRKFYKFN